MEIHTTVLCAAFIREAAFLRQQTFYKLQQCCSSGMVVEMIELCISHNAQQEAAGCLCLVGGDDWMRLKEWTLIGILLFTSLQNTLSYMIESLPNSLKSI